MHWPPRAAAATLQAMQVSLAEARALLARTPLVLQALLEGMPLVWTHGHPPGDDSAFVKTGQLARAERETWIPLLRNALGRCAEAPRERLDDLWLLGRTLPQVLTTFAADRRENLLALDALGLGSARLHRVVGAGAVTPAEVLRLWVVNDLASLGAITRTMAAEYHARQAGLAS